MIITKEEDFDKVMEDIEAMVGDVDDKVNIHHHHYHNPHPRHHHHGHHRHHHHDRSHQ